MTSHLAAHTAHRLPRHLKPLKLSAMLCICLGGLTSSPQVSALSFHVNGNTITATGDVAAPDAEKLARLLALTRENGKQINTLVLRNSPGGAPTTLPALQKIVRDNGLRTVVHGTCHSACADIFISGTERQFSEHNPTLDPFFRETTLGIHGTNQNFGEIQSPELQQPYIDAILGYLGDVGEDTTARINQAHFELQAPNGFLEYFDARTS